MPFKLLLVAVLLACPVLLMGQGDRVSITGLAPDGTGARVPGVEISVKHLTTNIVTIGKSLITGNHLFPRLPIGTYTLTARRQGFRTHQQVGILHMNQTPRSDILLSVGDIAKTVIVTGEAPIIQSESRFTWLQPGVTFGGEWEKHIAGGDS